MRRTRRAVVASVVAVAVLGTGTAMAAPTVSAQRHAGAHRYETARVIAEATFERAQVAVLASGENYPDALAASFRAGATRIPILLTTPDVLSPDARDALARLDVEGVVIVGGPAAVSNEIEAELDDLGYVVTRAHGADRYETAANAALSVPPAAIGGVNAPRTGIVVTGEGFADAIAGGPVAYAQVLPLLLTPRTSLHPATRRALVDLDIDEVLILGGTAAVSAEVQGEIESLGITVLRLSGPTSGDTAARLADLAIDQLGFSASHVNLARGDLFPDALAVSAHAGTERSVTVLSRDSTRLGAATTGWLNGRSETIESMDVFGGLAALSDEVVEEARAAAGHTGG